MLRKIIDMVRPVRYESISIMTAPPTELLKDKVILVIGASRGIGYNIAKTMSGAGANVILTARKQENFPAEAPGKCLEWDLSEFEIMNKKMQEVCNIYGKCPDVVVINAGVRTVHDAQRDLFSVESEDWEAVMKVNLFGVLEFTHTYVKILKGNNTTGKLIFISSIDGIKNGFTPYEISKYCLNKAMDDLNKLFSKICKIYAIAPGPTTTSMMSTNGIFRFYRADHPDRRCAVPQDIANVTLFLASDITMFKKGSIIVCDGGKSL